MKIELLAIDMDGTLLYPDDTIASQATEIIDKIAKKGVKIPIIGADKLKSFEKNGIRPERDGYLPMPDWPKGIGSTSFKEESIFQ